MNYKEQIKSKGLKMKSIAKELRLHDSVFSKMVNGRIDMPLHVEGRLKMLLKECKTFK